MTHWGDITAEARKRLTPVDTQLLRQFAARERQPYDQVLLPLLLEAAADEIDGYRAREAAEQQGDAEKEWQDEEFLALQVWPEGRKDDGGKAPHHLIAPEIQDALAQVLAFGARKYQPRNWERGMAWSRPFSALMRHMWAWWRGENLDQETGMSHLHHAACCIMFLVAYEQRRTGTDDRPQRAAEMRRGEAI